MTFMSHNNFNRPANRFRSNNPNSRSSRPNSSFNRSGGSSSFGQQGQGGGSRPGGRPGFGGGRPGSFQGSRPGSRPGGRPGFGGGNRGGGFRGGRSFNRRPKPSNGIHPMAYVRAAQPVAEQPVHAQRHASFSEFNLLPEIIQNVVNKGFVKPSPIQDMTIADILNGRDVLGIANTGTGKTAAFGLPMVDAIARSNGKKKALILAPTRELATQIDQEIRSFKQGMRMYTVLCIGGASMRPQIMSLRKNPQIIIGTPGRIKDLMEQGELRLDQVSIVVLDEVDRMLDMGFINDVREIVGKANPDRQTLFFSATMTKEVDSLVHTFLKDHLTVSLKQTDTSANIEQTMIRVADGAEKMKKLEEILSDPQTWKTIIFTRTKRGAENLSRKLRALNIKADSIHGDKPQRKREFAIHQLKTDRINVLVATDVAARGLDISDITHVINYDEPGTYEDYIHRIGRTGRAEKTGTSITFVESGPAPEPRPQTVTKYYR